MKKIILPLFSFLFCVQFAHGQLKNVDAMQKSLETTNKDTIAWTHGGVFDLGANEGFLHNWSAGGELASLTVNGLFSGYLNRLHNYDIWSNNLDLAYGLAYAYSTSFIPHKTDDRIDFTSKYGIRVTDSTNFYFTGLFNFKSQFTKGYNYTLPHFDSASTSKFMSPAYITTAIGMEYRRGSDISLFLSPLAARLVLADKYYTDMSDQGAFGVPYNKTSVFQLGAYFSGRYVININKKAVFKTRLDLYSNYLAKDTKDSTGAVIKKDNPGNIQVLFDNLFSYKLSSHFNMTVGLTLIYDNNFPYITTPQNQSQPGNNLGWTQVNETFNFGIEYKFH
jgi:hypothetical protein